jgi:CheY-like chemotaxis protein
MISVLVVEDEAPIREFIVGVLTDAGYHVLSARDGAQALAQVQATPPALVITDLMMPHMNGAELCRRIKAAFPDATIPVIMMSAGGLQPLRASGADAVLAKPFDIEQLLDLVTLYVGPADANATPP